MPPKQTRRNSGTANNSAGTVGTTPILVAGTSQTANTASTQTVNTAGTQTANTADTSGSQTVNAAGNSDNSAVGPGDVLLTERYFLDPSWPRTDVILDLSKSNWPEWNKRLTLAASRQGFSGWLNGTLPRPDANTSPKAHWIWNGSDE